MKANLAARTAKNPAYHQLSIDPQNLVIKLRQSPKFSVRGKVLHHRFWTTQIIRRLPDEGEGVVIFNSSIELPTRRAAVLCAMATFANFSKRNYPKWLKQKKGHLYPFMPDRLEKIRTKLAGGVDYCTLDQFYT